MNVASYTHSWNPFARQPVALTLWPEGGVWYYRRGNSACISGPYPNSKAAFVAAWCDTYEPKPDVIRRQRILNDWFRELRRLPSITSKGE